ncbi:hypothetical protein ACLOJK_018966, partial [Asimina triloba]
GQLQEGALQAFEVAEMDPQHLEVRCRHRDELFNCLRWARHKGAFFIDYQIFAPFSQAELHEDKG